MKDILVKKAIEILVDLKPIDNHADADVKAWTKAVNEEIDKKIEALKTGDKEKIKEFFQGCLDLFYDDLEGGWDCFGREADHFNNTALEIIARLYLNEPITYTRRSL